MTCPDTIIQGARAEKMAPPSPPGRRAIGPGYAAMRSRPLCWRSGNADPRRNARNAAKPAMQHGPLSRNVVLRGRACGGLSEDPT